MRCHTPGCTGEHQLQAISHSVLYRQRTLVVHGVPAAVCPDCGAATVAEETLLELNQFLASRGRSRGASLVFRA
ncbi:MAG TPA: YgiT-type zinc finger protein [Thermoanaerobaculia bacterium]|nr:YgiT-type zinc finger protein [Thermoanaerobaculia bacterium]